MENKISKILDDILARVAFDMTKRNIRHSFKDHLALEILRHDGSMAHNLLTTKLKGWELSQIQAEINSLITNHPSVETMSAEEFLRAYRSALLREHISVRNISSAHVLCDIVADTTAATSQVFAQYGISEHTILSIIREIGDRCEGMQSLMQTPQRKVS